MKRALFFLSSIIFLASLSFPISSPLAATKEGCWAPTRQACAGGIACAAGVCCPDQTSCNLFLQNNPDADTAGQQYQNLTGQTYTDLNGDCGDTAINTAIGCINYNSKEAFLTDVLKWAVGVGSGIAFILMLYAGFMTMTAQGNPERMKAGQELMTSAISGLILLVFSIFILNFIGIDILGLGSFGFGK